MISRNNILFPEKDLEISSISPLFQYTWDQKCSGLNEESTLYPMYAMEGQRNYTKHKDQCLGLSSGLQPSSQLHLDPGESEN